MGQITNRDPEREEYNQRLVEERKREMARGENPPGIQRGHSPREEDRDHKKEHSKRS